MTSPKSLGRFRQRSAGGGSIAARSSRALWHAQDRRVELWLYDWCLVFSFKHASSFLKQIDVCIQLMLMLADVVASRYTDDGTRSESIGIDS